MSKKLLARLSHVDKRVIPFIFGIVLPIIFVFKALFSFSSLALGDSPYLTADTLKWFLSEPSAWTQRGLAFGGVNQFLWISPYMSAVSAVTQLLSLSPWLVIRLFFLLPSLVLAPLGGYYLSRYFSASRLVSFFCAFFAIFNTYYLTIWDGGQVGVVLAYAIFPWTLLAMCRYLKDIRTRRQYVVALIMLCALTLADPRVAFICIATAFLVNPHKVKSMVLLLICWFFINLYWIYPLFYFGSEGSQGAEILKATSFLNGLFIYAPHWHENIYGKITYPSIFFISIPALILSNLFIKYKDQTKFLLIFLLFVFLIKGVTEPFGVIYQTLQRLPFGSAFRDSTKFLIPTVYIVGMLIGRAVEYWRTKLKNNYVPLIVYLLLLLPLFPAIQGKMNFVLSGRETTLQIDGINNVIRATENESRTAWFPERDPRSIESPHSEAIDAKSLINMRVFANLNVGTEDAFNFMNSKQTDWWLDLLNINYLVFLKDPRAVTLSELQQRDSARLNSLVKTLPYLDRKENDNLIYENYDVLPRIFGTNKMFVVLGSDNIYEKLLLKNPDFKPYNAGFSFIDDGKWDPSTLLEYATTSAILIKNSEGETDLTLSLLQKHFYSGSNAESSHFAVYTVENYLKYKYELLIRKVTFEDFDFSKGISFSTEAEEVLSFNIPIKSACDCTISIRHMAKDADKGLSVNIDGKEVAILAAYDKLTWSSLDVKLGEGSHTITFKNPGGLQIFNVFSIVPKEEFLKSNNIAKSILLNFPSYDIVDLPTGLLNVEWKPISYEAKGVNKFLLAPEKSINWIIWTNNFNPLWKVTRDNMVYKSIPFYSSVNGFYRRPEWEKMTLEFSGQESVRWGIYYSLLSIAVLILIFLCL